MLFDFDAVKDKVGPINEYFRTCHSMTSKTQFPPFTYLHCFKSDFNNVKSKAGLFKEKNIKTSYNISSTESQIFMKFETYAHKIVIDPQPNFHKDACT